MNLVTTESNFPCHGQASPRGRVSLPLVRAALLCALLTSLTVHALTVDIEAALTPENKKKLDAGQAVILKNKIEDHGQKVISNSAAMIVVDKTVEQTWPFLLDFEKFPEFIPRMTTSEKYAEKDGLIGISQALKILWKTIHYHVLQKNDVTAHTISFNLDKTQKNDVSDIEGQWQLRPYGEGKCLAVYSLALDSGIPVPRFIQNMLLNGDLPETMLAIKKRAESDGKYKKD